MTVGAILVAAVCVLVLAGTAWGIGRAAKRAGSASVWPGTRL